MPTSRTADRRAGGRRVIERPRLTRMLDEATARIILLTAPAGYGKTTLAQQWLVNRSHAWYRGTPASADVAALALGLAVAAREIVPRADERLRERLRATNHPEEETETLAELLAEDLADWPAHSWLAIDDYQFAMEGEAAERLVDQLVQRVPLRLFITSRNRPTWATARRILYGEIFELEREVLAMSDDEAGEVLVHRGEHAPAIVGRAKGWPAVISLAALADTPAMPENDLPAELYNYFAEELYLRAEPAVRWGLCQLAVAPAITPDLAEHLFGPEAGALILDHGVRLGVLTGERPGPYVLHPLLRPFLHSKLNEHGVEAVKHAVDTVTTFLVQRRRWDDAFSVLQRFGDGSSLTELIEAALDEMFEQGRLSTLVRWLDFSRECEIDEPILDLAQAEVAFRQGSHMKAWSLASHAAAGFDTSSPHASRALFRAGQSVHLSGREDLAIDLHRRAREVASTDDERVAAIHGQLVAALDLELDNVDDIRGELEELAPESPKASLRLSTARLIMATRRGGLEKALEEARASFELVPIVKDPVSRSAFQYVMSYSLGIAARYKEALYWANVALEEAQRYRLDFVFRHGYVSKAIAELGLRHFARAHSLLNRAERIARGVGDTHIEALVRAVRVRLILAEGKLSELPLQFDLERSVGVTKAMHGELIATLALCEACSGRTDSAEELASRAENVTVSTEAGALALWTRAIAEAMRGSARAKEVTSNAFTQTLRMGCIDFFVCAYRGHPPLVELASVDRRHRSNLAEILREARDFALARQCGLHVQGAPGLNTKTLTKRECEVYDLLRQGMSNREIATALFISEPTAKLHVRHILAKLGARTRTEAAAMGRQDTV
jgi:LuxR family maltose regulon positive regulatory protein